MKKSVIRIGSFILILGVILGYVNKVFKVKYSDGIYSVTKFYELEDDTVDVLILGSSHAFENFNTGTLWDEYGMASYILAGSLQPMWNTYYYLMEALKTQTPELIVLEGYMTCWKYEYIDDSRIIKNTYGLKWSKDKADAIKISAPEERWSEFFFEYQQYHTRYTELVSGDFLKNQDYRLYDDWKGFGCNMDTTPLDSIDVSGVTERTELYEKTEKYYRKIMELAKEKNIPIVVVISPYAGITEEEQKIFNAAGYIAAEYDVPFVNCNLMINEMGIDYSTDSGDDSHLNYKGNQKFSRYIGSYLKNNYDISDRRRDDVCMSWQRSADYTRQMIADQELIECKDIDVISEKIHNKYYLLIISVDGNCNTSDKNVVEFLQGQGIYDEGSPGIWVIENDERIWSSGMDDAEKYIRTSSHDFCLRRSLNASGQSCNEIIVDKIQYQKVENGVNVLIYDTMTEKIADVFGINMDDDYNVIR